MNNLKLSLLLGVFISLFMVPAHALVELKLGYGTQISSPSLGSLYTGVDSQIPAATPTAGTTLDAVVSIPLVTFGFGFGLRQEDMKISYDSSALDASMNFKRTSAIVNYRLIDTLLYVGPILTWGLSHSGNIELKSGSASVLNVDPGSVSSYSLGLEAGAHMLGFLVGAEAGLMDMRWKDAKDSVGGGKDDLNMSGNYVKLFVGLSI